MAFDLGITTLREGLYKSNFFTPENDFNDVSPENDILFRPTTLNEQTSWLASYDSWFEPVHDIYSLIYKPLTLIYASCRLFLQSGMLGLQCLTSCLSALVNLLPPLVASENLDDQLYVANLPEQAQACAQTFVAAVVLLTMSLPFDMISSVLSLVGRSGTSLFETVKDSFSNDESSEIQLR